MWTASRVQTGRGARRRRPLAGSHLAPVLAPLLAAVLALTACGQGAPAPAQPAAQAGPTSSSSSSPSTAAPSAKPLQKVSLRLDWLATSYDAPFAVAKEKGYYRDAGLDVSIQEGRGSATTVQVVGNGDDTFGLADSGTAALSISKGTPIKVLAVYLQKTPFSFIYHQGTNLSSPADLKGQEIIDIAGGSTGLMLRAVLDRNHIPRSSIHFDLVAANAKTPTFAKNQKAILLGYSTDFPGIKKVVPDALVKGYSAFGVNLYSTGLVASLAEIQNHPDVVKAFMAATTRGWEYAAQHQSEGVDDLLKVFPKLDGAIEKAAIPIVFTLLHTDATSGHPAGWMAPSDWQATIDLLHNYSGMTDVKPVGDYYTDQFIPQS